MTNQKYMIRARHHGSCSFYVFMSKDAWNCRDSETGSVYYWSNNQLISKDTSFDSETAALKAFNRLGTRVKDKVHSVEVVPYEDGKQIFYIDGRTS